MTKFFQTRMGQHFYEGTVPRILRALERIADALERTPKAHVPAPNDEDQIIIPLPGGGSLRCDRGDKHMWGSAVHLYDQDGENVQTWTCDEWEQEGEGEQVMGAIFAAAVSLPEKRK